jgi:hypothetical protein
MSVTRNRRFFQGDNLYVGPSPSTGNFFTDIAGNKINDATGNNLIEQLYRVQSYSYDMNSPKELVNQLGELSEIDQVTMTTPTVNLNFNYLLANFENERRLGFVVDGSETCVRDILNKTQDDKCYFIRSAPEGIDGVSDQTMDTTVSVLGFGNGYMTSYSTEASVGSMPTVSISVEGLNCVYSQNISGYSPSINPDTGLRLDETIFKLPFATTNPSGSGDASSISVLRAGDITVTLTQADSSLNSLPTGSKSTYSTMGANLATARVQSYSLGFDLSRTPIEGLGSRYAFDREVSYPSTVTFTIEALAGDLNTGSWSDLIECTKVYDVQVDLKEPSCGTPSSRDVVAQYLLKNTRMISYSSSMGIGDNQTVNMQFQSTLAGAKSAGTAAQKGLFMSGIVEA